MRGGPSGPPRLACPVTCSADGSRVEEAVERELEIQTFAKRSIGPGRRCRVAVREWKPFDRAVERVPVAIGRGEVTVGRQRELEVVQVHQPVMCRTDEYEIAQFGRSAVDPVVQVVGLQPTLVVAAGHGARAMAGLEGAALERRWEAATMGDADDRAIRAVLDDADLSGERCLLGDLDRDGRTADDGAVTVARSFPRETGGIDVDHDLWLDHGLTEQELHERVGRPR